MLCAIYIRHTDIAVADYGSLFKNKLNLQTHMVNMSVSKLGKKFDEFSTLVESNNREHSCSQQTRISKYSIYHWVFTQTYTVLKWSICHNVFYFIWKQKQIHSRAKQLGVLFFGWRKVAAKRPIWEKLVYTTVLSFLRNAHAINRSKGEVLKKLNPQRRISSLGFVETVHQSSWKMPLQWRTPFSYVNNIQSMIPNDQKNVTAFWCSTGWHCMLWVSNAVLFIILQIQT